MMKVLFSACVPLFMILTGYLMSQKTLSRKYYLGNATATFAFAGSGVALTVWTHNQIEAYKAQFLEINFDDLAFFAEMMDTPYIDSTFWFDAHYAVFGLLMVISLALVANLIWKKRLMKAEQHLIDEGKKVQS